ncbi:hypothetical protein LRK24_11285 [Rhodanobacter denitrificans]|uniref:nSTAND3 domain-containing NTPase n=1 Tax=Rhodanobacter TaxID=75309 RepID=UPI000260D509|nr:MULTISPECIES: hypothetical protein [Rhodanobacter]EIM04330.1 hypothetical protein UUC_03880 [Rhodanobacter denitrificans]UJM89031.1 hypothetical protein LRK24_11285 [Rhodanobacter denitrificans]
MNIAIVAPRKFDFQDLVCVERLLTFHSHCDVTFWVEKEGGEDAEMRLGGAAPKAIELQIKGSSSRVTLEDLASWLTHFPSLKDENCLLERLLGNDDLFVHFIVSGRCNDDSAEYLASDIWASAYQELKSLPRKAAIKLINTISDSEANASKKDSDLECRRRAHLQQLLKGLRPQQATKALRRVVITDQATEETVRDRCERMLRSVFSVPGDEIDSSINVLRDVVKLAKNEASDAFESFRGAIEKIKPEPIRPPKYVSRGCETQWLDQLSKHSVLLLSGTPRSGKTFTARWLTAELGMQGYAIRHTSSVEAAERFLLDFAAGHRVVLLDDPLGGAHPAADPHRELHRIRSLIPKLGPGRKLIIAQAQEILFEVLRVDSLNNITLAGRRWIDCTGSTGQFLAKIWDEVAASFDVPVDLSKMVYSALESEQLVLEPGCLAHLAASVDRIVGPLDLPTVERLARQTASELGQAWREEGVATIAACLAVCTQPDVTVSQTELAYVLGQGGSRLPGLIVSPGFSLTLGPLSDSSKNAEVHYQSIAALDGDDVEKLDKLELRRIIAWGGSSSLNFTHPFYRSAAEILLDDATRSSKEQVLKFIERGLFCLSAATSRSTARSLHWILLQFRTDSGREAIAEQAIAGLSSIYPSTRDLCFEFLVTNLHKWKSDQSEQFQSWIWKVTAYSELHVTWRNGEAVIVPDVSPDTLLSDILRTTEDSDATSDAKELNTLNGVGISPERAWKALDLFTREPHELARAAMGRLLSYDEALIRAKAVACWLDVPREDDSEILDRVFGERHPSIAHTTLVGVIESWQDCSEARQRMLLEGLQRQARTPVMAAGMIERLLVFNRGAAKTGGEPWVIWGEILPLVLDALPLEYAFSEPRLFEVAERAIGNISSAAYVRLCERWIAGIERLASKKLLSDFRLGVTQLLICATESEPSLRGDLVRRLIMLPGTASRLRVAADLVDHWSKLSREEKEVLIEQITEDKVDAKWLRAAVLTRKHVAEEIQSAVLGRDLRLQHGAEKVLEYMDAELLSACICIYVGRPQPLWYLGTHHSGASVWRDVVAKVALDPGQPMFDAAWEDLTYSENGRAVAEVVVRLDPVHAASVLDVLLDIKLATNGGFIPEAWAALLKLAPDEEVRSAWISKMAAIAPNVLQSIAEARNWLRGSDLKEFLEHFEPDLLLHTVLDHLTAETVTEPDVAAAATILVAEMLRRAGVSFEGSYSRSAAVFKKLGLGDASFFDEAEELRQRCLSKRRDGKMRTESWRPSPWLGSL